MRHHKGGEGEKQCSAVDAARKMLKFGISALTDVELLALFLRPERAVKMY